MSRLLVRYGMLFRFLLLHKLIRIIQPVGNIRITFTHGVNESDIDNFTQLVQFLSKIRNIISPETFISNFCNGKIFDEKCLLMTFDDGLVSSYRAAKNVLEPLGIKAIFFIPTAVIKLNTDEEMRRFASENIHYNSKSIDDLIPEEYQFMNIDHIADLISSGHMICPHTHNHVFLSDITNKDAVFRELVQPKNYLEDLFNTKIRAFAFPVGTEKQVSRFAYGYVKQYYECCFTAINGINYHKTNPHFLYRDHLSPEASISYIRMVMDGTYDLYYAMRMKKMKTIA